MRKIYILLLMMVAVGGSRATTREFTVRNSEDDKSIIQVFLPAPDKASGRMVIACPGGGYGWLSMDAKGTGTSSPITNDMLRTIRKFIELSEI